MGVLILVVVEVGLGQLDISLYNANNIVLILVVVEVGLGQQNS